jgi:hypothetical protein
MRLAVNTDPELYDHKLTLVLEAEGKYVTRVLQEGDPVQEYESDGGKVLIHVKPMTSDIAIHMGTHHDHERQPR